MIHGQQADVSAPAPELLDLGPGRAGLAPLLRASLCDSRGHVLGVRGAFQEDPGHHGLYRWRDRLELPPQTRVIRFWVPFLLPDILAQIVLPSEQPCVQLPPPAPMGPACAADAPGH